MTESLHSALAELQSSLPIVAKNSTAKIPTKNGGEFSYSYADLASINEALLPALATVGLTWVCMPTVEADRTLLTGQLTHAGTGDSLSGSWPLPRTDEAQRLGSAVTYGRRYLLCAMVGLVPDEDDDGRRAQQAAPQPDVPDFTVLTELIAEATEAGVQGDFDATAEWASESDANLVAAISRIRKAIAEKVVGGES